MSNPLLKDYNTVFETVPFSDIKEEHFLPALKEAVKEAKAEVDAITNQTEDADFSNTIEALEASGERVSKIAEVFFNLNSAETNEEIQKIARDFSPILTEYGNDILLNQALFNRVNKVYQQKSQLNLNAEGQMLLDKTYKGFIRNGAALSDDDKLKLRELDKELGQLSLQFGENVLAATNAFEMVLEENQLGGLPQDVKDAAAEEAEQREMVGKYVFTLQYPSYIPFVTYSTERALREKMVRAFGKRAFADEHDNQEIVLKIAQLRNQRAKLLGFNSHADFILQERMAKSPEGVFSFLDKIKEVAVPAAEQDIEALKRFASKDGISDFKRWDMSYYSEKLKKERYEIDDELLKPYFKLQNVISGAFQVARKLYGISFKERTDIQKYHEDVTTYEVLDENGAHLAVFYADFFPRKGKRNGAWMTSYRSQKLVNGVDIRPHISIVCNFTKPTKTRPSLLTFQEVTTLFHEFGHALHGIMAKGTYASLSGTNVYWDFVELPSQLMENWCYEKECLDLFATHFETGEKIPAEVVERLKKSAQFMEGYATARQIGLGLLDMNWHIDKSYTNVDVPQVEAEAMASTEVLPKVEGSNTSTSFSHIFQGGYSAGYYSYKWAEVLDADAFEFFKERGIFNEEVASRFRRLLEAGGTCHPSEVYREFRGKDPDPEALLRRAGLIKQSQTA